MFEWDDVVQVLEGLGEGAGEGAGEGRGRQGGAEERAGGGSLCFYCEEDKQGTGQSTRCSSSRGEGRVLPLTPCPWPRPAVCFLPCALQVEMMTTMPVQCSISLDSPPICPQITVRTPDHIGTPRSGRTPRA